MTYGMSIKHFCQIYDCKKIMLNPVEPGLEVQIIFRFESDRPREEILSDFNQVMRFQESDQIIGKSSFHQSGRSYVCSFSM